MKKLAETKITESVPITSWEIDGETVETVADYFFGLLQMVIAAMKLKDAYSWRKSYDQPR